VFTLVIVLFLDFAEGTLAEVAVLRPNGLEFSCAHQVLAYHGDPLRQTASPKAPATSVGCDELLGSMSGYHCVLEAACRLMV